MTNKIPEMGRNVKYCVDCHQRIEPGISPLTGKLIVSRRKRCWSCSQAHSKQLQRERIEHRFDLPRH